MEHYITNIRINELRHLSDIDIHLNSKNRQHLLITGKNGSGKTSFLLALVYRLSLINENNYKLSNQSDIKRIREYYFRLSKNFIEISFSKYEDLKELYSQGNFIIAYFPADRKTKMVRSQGVEDIKLSEFYGISDEPSEIFQKYMVHLKTQQSYARNEGDIENVERIQKWFDRLLEALKVLMDDTSITLEYNYKQYDFKIHQKGRNPFGFDELSDGYSSVINIVSDLIIRMDKNWLLCNKTSEYNIEGIVLIDELETHLHIELQKKILPFLTMFFPKIQFIITTHSPYILNSISNAKAYDLENCVELENLSAYSSEGLAQGYFDVDEYSEELKNKLEKYEYLIQKTDLTDEERAQRAEIRCELKNIPRGLVEEIKDKFEEIEGKH